MGEPATKLTDVVAVAEPIVAVMVSPWALVEDNVVLHVPKAFVVPVVPLHALPVPVVLTETVWFGTRLPYASFAVTTTLVVLTPSAVTIPGVAVTVHVLLDAVPAVKVTDAVGAAVPAVAVTVFTCAVVDASVAVKTPALLVVPVAGVNVLLAPVLDSVTF